MSPQIPSLTNMAEWLVSMTLSAADRPVIKVSAPVAHILSILTSLSQCPYHLCKSYPSTQICKWKPYPLLTAGHTLSTFLSTLRGLFRGKNSTAPVFPEPAVCKAWHWAHLGNK